MKKYLLAFLLFSCKTVFCQLNDSFDDGDFTSNPVWSGSNTSNDFTIIANRLRSNSVTTSSNFYLSTANTLATNCTWEFYCNLQFNTSGANYVDVYLISDQADLQSADINGYFVRIGNTDDEISLYKRTGSKNTSIKIIDGANGSFNTSNNTVKIKVTRTAENLFILERDLTGTGSAYMTEGSITDADIISSTYFGIYIQQSTASFIQKHFFDDFKIEAIVPDVTPPTLLAALAIDTLTVDAIFSEAMDSVSAKLNLNYMLNNGAGNPVSVSTTSDNFRYRLVFSNSLNTANYTLTATHVKDLNDNMIGINNTADFSFVKPYIAKPHDLIINEIFADPSPQIDLPTVEFIELFNTSANVISLKNWIYSDADTHFTFTKDSILPGEYLILCAKADTAEFNSFGRVLGISPWPSLNNSGDAIKLLSPQSTLIDSVAYSDTWYRGSAKKAGGWTLERIDPQSK
ncbi:MAG: lamin tail domain-containing protein, partial [Daejeonella sp.]